MRREAALTAERRPDTVHLHGVGMMKEDDLKQYFADYGDSHVEWVDEASCELTLCLPNCCAQMTL